MAQSMATLEDDSHFRVTEHRTAKESGIETTNCSSSSCIIAEREKTSERDINSDSSSLEPNRTHRPEGDIGDVTGDPRTYANPRHCYRVPPKQPLLGSSVVLNRSVPIRAIAAFAPRNSRPPIREPNVSPDKRDEKKDERKDRQEKKKKPMIRTDDGSVVDSESRTAMVADDNQTGDPETTFRYEWGVKLAEGSANCSAELDDSDNVAEKNPRYVTKRLWGVNLKQPRSDLEVSEGDAEQQIPDSASSISAGIDEETRSNEALEDAESAAVSGTTADYLSTPSSQSDSVPTSGTDKHLIATRREASNATSPLNDPRKLQETISPSTQMETIAIDDDYNVPADAASDAEIAAWKSLMMKSQTMVTVLEKQNFLSADHVENLQMVSIRPEPPEPKLDVRVVRSIEDGSSKDEDTDHPDAGFVKSAEPKRPESVDVRKFDNYSPSKKLHTASWQIRHAHRDTRSVIHCCNELLPVEFASVDATIPTSAALSTESEDSFEKEKPTNETSMKQTIGRHEDAKGQEPKSEREHDDCNGSSSSTQRSVLPINTQTLLNSSKEVDINLMKKLTTIADGETVISSNQSLIRDADPSEVTRSSECRKDYNHYKDVLDDNDTNSENSSFYDGRMDTTANSKAARKDRRKATSSQNDHGFKMDRKKERSDDSNYVRLPGDTYPYSKEHLDKWRVLCSKTFPYKPIKQGIPYSDSPIPKNPSELTMSGVVESHDSHSGMAVTETPASGSRVLPWKLSDNCLQEDAADTLGLQQWTEAFSKLEGNEKANEAARVDDDNASLRAYRR